MTHRVACMDVWASVVRRRGLTPAKPAGSNAAPVAELAITLILARRLRGFDARDALRLKERT